MPTYKTPDVYVEEISTFPPSVAEVETAIPAFIGYTETAKLNTAGDLLNKPTEIFSWTEYEAYFGGPCEDALAISVSNDNTAASGFKVDAFSVNGHQVTGSPTDPLPGYLMYYAVKMFFDNGGGKCYIVSVGDYTDTINEKDLEGGLGLVALEDEPTMLVIPEAAVLGSGTNYQNLVTAMLNQCGGPPPTGLHDRFAIFDIFDGDAVLDATAQGTNRSYFGNYLSYGAAYYPFLRTTLNFFVADDESNVSITYPGGDVSVRAATSGTLPNNNFLNGTMTAAANGVMPQVGGVALQVKDELLVKDEADKKNNGIYVVVAAGAAASADDPGGSPWVLKRTSDALVPGMGVAVSDGTNAKKVFALSATAPITPNTTELTFQEAVAQTLASLKTPKTALYNFVKAALQNQYVVMPPSGAVAGVYAATDTTRGVWKAPANVALADVIEPVIRVDNAHQDTLNVDPTTGKSINALREFTGKGTLVWGARTLDGNSNEWRYVSVRRFFIMVEESVKDSTYWAVFEPNDANTWVKVRGMIENYLTQKWREGALAGATPKDAFYVKCGLGTTMTSDDVLNGLMNVEIGMAVVRPAEFIVLKFSHKLQTS